MNFSKLFFQHKEISIQDVFFERMKKAVDVIGVNAIVCSVVAAFYGHFVLKNNTSWYVLLGVPFYVLSIALNRHRRIILALSLQSIVSTTLLTIFSIRTGEDSYTHVHFILAISGISLLYNKKETRFHFYLNSVYVLVCLTIVYLSFYFGFFQFLRDPLLDPEVQRHLNFLFLVVCSIIITTVISVTNKRQQDTLEQAVSEQRILLAEVNHRVKNNLAIIVSLLNLQSHTAKSKETKDAIQVVHNRVMSMALVHLRMYENKSKSAADLKPYIKELVTEITNSIGISNSVEINYELDTINLDVSAAIPMGLILNELITNSIKHAFEKVENPCIEISLKKIDRKLIELIFKDNGKGMCPEKAVNEGIGLGLIQSLAEQLDGTCTFLNERGMTFYLAMPYKE
jgi:two-component sensor histidine kinase